jgi:hypothetical protein
MLAAWKHYWEMHTNHPYQVDVVQRVVRRRQVRRDVWVARDELLEPRQRRAPLRVDVHRRAVQSPHGARKLRGEQQLQAQLRLGGSRLAHE